MDIVVWGTGFAAHELLENNLKNVKVSYFVDNDTNIHEVGGVKVISPIELLNIQYDAVIVANNYSPEIYTQAVSMGLDILKFIFIYRNYENKDLNSNYELIRDIFNDEMVNIIKNRYHVVRGMMIDEIEKQKCLGVYRNSGLYDSDYIRIRNFELIVNEIKDRKVNGAVAELGVFKGEFAQYINASFPERKCYLFDTFNGFRAEEAETEKKNGNCGDAFVNRFKDTTLEKVIALMPNKENVIIKQGLFPESLENLDEIFAFVSIDVDFEKAIYDGIEYFYPRLCKGGYMFIHDYNSSSLKGVKKAIRAYEHHHGIYMAKMPICDLCGTLIITK